MKTPLTVTAFLFFIFSDLPNRVFQLSLLELVFNGVMHMTLLRDKDGPLLEAQLEPLVLLEDG